MALIDVDLISIHWFHDTLQIYNQLKKVDGIYYNFLIFLLLHRKKKEKENARATSLIGGPH